MSDSDEKKFKELANIITTHCYRNNTSIEDLHAGTSPSSKTGDYSDVYVVSPFGKIPWNELSRISDDEMKTLNKEIHNNMYTMLYLIFIKGANLPWMFTPSTDWDEPELNKEWIDYFKKKSLI